MNSYMHHTYMHDTQKCIHTYTFVCHTSYTSCSSSSGMLSNAMSLLWFLAWLIFLQFQHCKNASKSQGPYLGTIIPALHSWSFLQLVVTHNLKPSILELLHGYPRYPPRGVPVGFVCWVVSKSRTRRKRTTPIESVGLERSSTGRTKVAVVLSCNDKGNKLALKQVWADTTLQTSIRTFEKRNDPNHNWYHHTSKERKYFRLLCHASRRALRTWSWRLRLNESWEGKPRLKLSWANKETLGFFVSEGYFFRFISSSGILSLKVGPSRRLWS